MICFGQKVPFFRRLGPDLVFYCATESLMNGDGSSSYRKFSDAKRECLYRAFRG